MGETGWEGSVALLSWGGIAGLLQGGEASHPVARSSRKEELAALLVCRQPAQHPGF